jgi:hypothetical protein
VKIKPPSRKHTLKSRLAKTSAHWWLVPQAPKKKGRLGQLQKANRALRASIGPSEFQVMVHKIEQKNRE